MIDTLIENVDQNLTLDAFSTHDPENIPTPKQFRSLIVLLHYNNHLRVNDTVHFYKRNHILNFGFELFWFLDPLTST